MAHFCTGPGGQDCPASFCVSSGYPQNPISIEIGYQTRTKDGKPHQRRSASLSLLDDEVEYLCNLLKKRLRIRAKLGVHSSKHPEDRKMKL